MNVVVGWLAAGVGGAGEVQPLGAAGEFAACDAAFGIVGVSAVADAGFVGDAGHDLRPAAVFVVVAAGAAVLPHDAGSATGAAWGAW